MGRMDRVFSKLKIIAKTCFANVYKDNILKMNQFYKKTGIKIV
jgi:hypothetical protein